MSASGSVQECRDCEIAIRVGDSRPGACAHTTMTVDFPDSRDPGKPSDCSEVGTLNMKVV